MDLRTKGLARRAAAVSAVAVLAAATQGSGAAAAPDPACETVTAPTYEVSLEVGRRTYRVGDTARVEATVTRIETGTPVEDIPFFAIVPFRKAMVLDYEMTDASGHAVVELELRRRYVRLGPARLIGIAHDEVAGTTCATVVEHGEKRIRNAFVIKP